MPTYLNRGIYDLVEVARLLGRSPVTVARWTEAKTTRPALLEPQLGPQLFSFHDLVSLQVISRLSQRKVPLLEISNMTRRLAKQLGTDRPLAHQDLPDLATVGKSVFVEESGEWVDGGQGGQGAFQEMIRADLQRLEYGGDKMAALWRPHDSVLLNPRVQAGAPCVEQTRITTQLIADLAVQGEDPHDIASDYELDLDAVLHALAWERSLDRRVPLAA